MRLAELSLGRDGTLGGIQGPQRETVERLRAIIRAGAPQLLEQVRWKIILYEGRAPIVALMAYDKYVQVAFFQGVRLRVPPDMVERSGAREPQYLLRGVADRMRWLRFDTADSVDEATVSGMLQQAVALDEATGAAT